MFEQAMLRFCKRARAVTLVRWRRHDTRLARGGGGGGGMGTSTTDQVVNAHHGAFPEVRSSVPSQHSECAGGEAWGRVSLPRSTGSAAATAWHCSWRGCLGREGWPAACCRILKPLEDAHLLQLLTTTGFGWPLLDRAGGATHCAELTRKHPCILETSEKLDQCHLEDTEFK